MIPARSRSRSRLESSPRDRPGAPSAISLKVWQPTRMFLRMIMVQRSARSSDVGPMGQYSPQLLQPPAAPRGTALTSAKAKLDGLVPPTVSTARMHDGGDDIAAHAPRAWVTSRPWGWLVHG